MITRTKLSCQEKWVTNRYGLKLTLDKLAPQFLTLRGNNENEVSRHRGEGGN